MYFLFELKLSQIVFKVGPLHFHPTFGLNSRILKASFGNLVGKTEFVFSMCRTYEGNKWRWATSEVKHSSCLQLFVYSSYFKILSLRAPRRSVAVDFVRPSLTEFKTGFKRCRFSSGSICILSAHLPNPPKLQKIK